MANTPVSQPTTSFFFPNGLGEGQAVSIDAVSMEEALRQLDALKNPAPAKAPVAADQSAEKEA